jgi:ABC-type nitrate/sulfonate/bicarbonate transport system ATPase subunit
MAQVALRNIVKTFDKTPAVRGIDIDIADREFIVLVGPSGCGKSTTLRMIAGLEEATSGEIYIGDQLVNDVPPKDRDIAMVFQNYALYPHMTVFENMSFGLRLKKVPKPEINERVQAAARILAITELLDRRPKQLSGGQRQRVAMGRAIVRHPKVFLFDEPLSNLDAKLRVQMRTEIKKNPPDGDDNHRLRYPRPDRGDDPGRSRRYYECWADRPDRHAARGLPFAADPVCRRLYRLTDDEFAALPPCPERQRSHRAAFRLAVVPGAGLARSALS